MIIFVMVIVIILGIVISVISGVKSLSSRKNDAERETTVRPTAVPEQRAAVRKEQNLRDRPRMMPRITAPDGHTHEGEAETYEKIVGSLGNVYDEGCAELDGIRLIMHDGDYDTSKNGRNFDKKKVAQAIVLGDVLGEPRCKRPYGRK